MTINNLHITPELKAKIYEENNLNKSEKPQFEEPEILKGAKEDSKDGNPKKKVEDKNDVNKKLLVEKKSTGELTPEEQARVNELKAIDQKVRAHEQAHLSAASGLSASSPSYSYTRGPDGKNYAVGGEVNIDTGAISDDPQATINKMRAVQSAALAPSDPSAQDRAVAQAAAQQIAQAQAELSKLNTEEKTESPNLEQKEENHTNQIGQAYSKENEQSGKFLDLLL